MDFEIIKFFSDYTNFKEVVLVKGMRLIEV